MSTDRPGSRTEIASARQLTETFRPQNPSRGRLGIEWENLPLDEEGRLVPFHGPGGVEGLLESVAGVHRPVREKGRLIALRLRGGGTVGLEPGAQVEIAPPPSDSLDALHRSLAQTWRMLDGAARTRGIRLSAWGLAPMDREEQWPDVPKARYGILKAHLLRSGTRGRRMMKLTAATQFCLDYLDEEEMRHMASGAARLLPYLMAATANSPVYAGRRSRWASQRPWIWRGTDPLRCGLPAFILSPRLGYGDWVRYGLDRPVLMFLRGGEYVAGDGRTFREWWKRPGALGPLTVGDWELHWSTLFPELRLRRYLEIRTLDSMPLPVALAVAAFLKGLLSAPGGGAEWRALLPERTPAQLRADLLEAARAGAGWRPPGRPLKAAMAGLLDAAGKGLSVLGEKEIWLAPLRELADRGSCLADLWFRDASRVWRGPQWPDPQF
jgi:glutamate--cysteine ligase